MHTSPQLYSSTALLYSELSVARRRDGRAIAKRGTPTNPTDGLSDKDRGEEDGVGEEGGPKPGRAGQHHEITHPPENHLQSRRRRISSGP